MALPKAFPPFHCTTDGTELIMGILHRIAVVDNRQQNKDCKVTGHQNDSLAQNDMRRNRQLVALPKQIVSPEGRTLAEWGSWVCLARNVTCLPRVLGRMGRSKCSCSYSMKAEEVLWQGLVIYTTTVNTRTGSRIAMTHSLHRLQLLDSANVWNVERRLSSAL